MSFRDDLIAALSKQMEPSSAEAMVRSFDEYVFDVASKGASEGATKVVKPIYIAVGILGAINLLRLLGAVFRKTPRGSLSGVCGCRHLRGRDA